MWATHALGISYEIKKTQGIGSGQVLFFPISRSICNAFHYLSSVDNDLQSKQTANDKIYSAKPDQTHLWVPLVLFLFARWETVAMSTTRVKSIRWNCNPIGSAIGNRIPDKKRLPQKGMTKKAPQINANEGPSGQQSPRIWKMEIVGQSASRLPFSKLSTCTLHKSIMRFGMQLSHIMALPRRQRRRRRTIWPINAA